MARKFMIMTFSLLAMAASGCRTSQGESEAKDVQDIAGVVNNNGEMNVICRDGRNLRMSPEVFQQQVVANTICDPDTGGGGGGTTPPNPAVFCVPAGAGYAEVHRSGDNAKIGSYGSVANCQKAIQTAKNDLVCGLDGDYAYVYRVSTNVKIGSYSAAANCFKAVEASSDKMVCKLDGDYGYVTRIADGKVFESYCPLNACTSLTKGSKATKICACNGDYAYIYDVNTAQRIGDYSSHATCLQLLGN